MRRAISSLDGVIEPNEYTRTVEYRVGNADLGATIYTGWSEGMFYVAADITDDMISVYCDEPWWNDNLQIRIDAQKDGWEFLHGNQNYRLYILPKGNGNNAKVTVHNYYADDPNDSAHPLDAAVVTAKYMPRAGGYTIEIAIPDSLLPGVTFAADASIRLTFYVKNSDEWPGWPNYNLMSKLDGDRPGFVTLRLKD